MVDDQYRCEWVNVSSSTGSPRQSWTKGHKTVVDVVVLAVVVQCFYTAHLMTELTFDLQHTAPYYA